MKASKGGIGKAVDRPDPRVRFYLFHGPDEAQSQAFADRLGRALDSEKLPIAGSAIRGNPALLADEAGAISLFGGKKLVWVQPAGEEIVAGVEALLEVPAIENVVVAIAGALKKSSGLLKLAESSPAALSHASYVPEGQDAERMVVELGRAEGLSFQPGVAARIAEACDGDRRMVAQELAKLALYVDASPQAPAELGHDSLEAVGAGIAGKSLRIADLALCGQVDALAGELSKLPPGGNDAIPIIRSLQRRLLAVAPLRARIDGGERASDVMASAGRALFWKDKPTVESILRRWDSAGLARVAERAGQLERDLMLRAIPPVESLGEELGAIARVAARRR